MVAPRSMIQLEKISKSFGPKKVLDGISLELMQKKTHVVLGSSGCGKSTLLRLILGLEQPNSGRVTLGGTPMDAAHQGKLVQQVGYVIQDGGLFPHLTAEENVTLAARIQKWPAPRIAKRLQELSDLIGLEESLFKRYPKQLSGGQRQRLGLMRALMLDPTYLLLDEPLEALDPIARSNLQTELKRIFNLLDKTVVWVTHNMNEAAFFGHTITLIHHGRVEQHGSLAELVRHPASAYITEFLNAQKPSLWHMEAFQ